MFWRISAALIALYLVHGADNTARDGARLATAVSAEVRNGGPQAVVSFCVEKPEICQAALRQASGLTAPEAQLPVPPADTRTPGIVAVAPTIPVATTAFPLPPVRPAGLLLRKGA